MGLSWRGLVFVAVLLTAYYFRHGALAKMGDSRDDQSKKEVGFKYMLYPTEPRWRRIFSQDDIRYTVEGPRYLVLTGHVFEYLNPPNFDPTRSVGAFLVIGRNSPNESFRMGYFGKEASSEYMDLEGLPCHDYERLLDHLDYLHEHSKFVGYLSGKYFDVNGVRTEAYLRLGVELAGVCQRPEHAPGCNSEFREGVGSVLWCSTKSGGVSRDWAGFPRNFTKGLESPTRCVCIKPKCFLASTSDYRVKRYPDCEAMSVECILPE